MTPPSRRDRRSDYRNFPAAYGELFMLCRDGERHVLGPFDTEKAARAAARDLYRYRGFLRTAVETDHSDVFARQVHDVARDLKIEVVHIESFIRREDDPSKPSVDQYHIALALNPIVAAVARMTTDASLSRRATVSAPPNDTSDCARAKNDPCEDYCGRVDCYIDDEQFRCAESTAPAQRYPALVHLDARDPDHSRSGIFVYHNCSRCDNGQRLDRCPTPSAPGNCGFPQARND